MFSSITFWCEFPERVDWKNLSVPFDTKIYITAATREEFDSWRKKIPKRFKLGVWPTLPKDQGYWFSGFCSKESISKLLQFKGLDVKVDVELPIPRLQLFSSRIFFYGLRMFMKKGRNNRFLRNTVEVLAKDSDVIISGLPLPRFLLKRYGDNFRRGVGRRNFFIYTTLFPVFLKPFLAIYYKWFVRSRTEYYKERTMFAIGCVGHGVFGNEPIYESIRPFEKDLRWFSSLGVKNLVVFNLHGISTREDSQEWFSLLEKYLER